MRSIPSDHGRFHTRKAGPTDDSTKGKYTVLTSALLTGEICDTDHTCRRAQLGGRDARHGAVTGTDNLLCHALTGYIEE